METTFVHWYILGIMEMNMETKEFRVILETAEKTMETAIVCWSYMGIMFLLGSIACCKCRCRRDFCVIWGEDCPGSRILRQPYKPLNRVHMTTHAQGSTSIP